jgi:putative GTP pyrophosphokinase
MTEIQVPQDLQDEFARIVEKYGRDYEDFERVATGLSSLFNSRKISPLIHSLKVRVKDPEHLLNKLERKYREKTTAGLPFEINLNNVYEKVNDLVGVRIIHLHTRQYEKINKVLLELLADEYYEVVEGPSARYWDNEYKNYFESVGISVEENPRLYTSVHYVVKPTRKNAITAEIQVRTLAEELWGEVDHSINYPVRSDNIAVTEQLLVLARVTSSCTRLVDSIFKTLSEGPGDSCG